MALEVHGMSFMVQYNYEQKEERNEFSYEYGDEVPDLQCQDCPGDGTPSG